METLILLFIKFGEQIYDDLLRPMYKTEMICRLGWMNPLS